MTIIAGHLTYLLISLSYLLHDIVWLRVVAMAASMFAIFYNYCAVAEPLWIPIGWNFVFLAINGCHLLQLRHARFPQGLLPEEIDLSRSFLVGATPAQLTELFAIGCWRDLVAGDVLAKEGSCPGQVAVLYDGEVQVLLDGRARGRIREWTFIGEISFLTGESASATVVATKSTRVLVWSTELLQQLLDKDQDLDRVFQNWLALDLTRKLIRFDEDETQRSLVGAS